MTIMKKTAAVTGHRKLFGYDPKSEGNRRLKDAIKDILVKEGVQILWTGMALGTDQIAALAAIELKQDGYPIELYAAVPFRNYDEAWPSESRELYARILEQCDRVDLVHDGEYDKRALEERNHYMVDRAESVIAVYTGAPGGTQRCIKYARQKMRNIIYIDPNTPEHPVTAYARKPRRIRRISEATA